MMCERGRCEGAPASIRALHTHITGRGIETADVFRSIYLEGRPTAAKTPTITSLRSPSPSKDGACKKSPPCSNQQRGGDFIFQLSALSSARK